MVKFLEDMNNFRFKACSEALGKRVETVFLIYDCSGAGVTTIDRTLIAMYHSFGDICLAMYPETLVKIACVNVPWALRWVITMTKSFVDEKTRDKYIVCGEDYQEQLREHIEDDQLPDFLGGSCTECKEVAGTCSYSNRGPWQDYKPVLPFGCTPIQTQNNAPPATNDASDKDEISVAENH